MKAMCLVALLVPGLALCQVANLIANPGFEDGKDAPLSWDLGMEGRGAGSAVWSTEGPHAGVYCARVELTETGDYWMARQNFAPGTAKGEHPYRLSGWYKGTASAAHPCVYFRGADGAFLGAWETTLPETKDWRPFDFVFTSRPGTDRFELQLRIQGVQGVAWWDDVALEDAEELVKQGETMVAPLLKLAEDNPDHIWAIVSNGGKAEFQFVGAPVLSIAWAVANAEGAKSDYGIAHQVRGFREATDIAERPTNTALQTRHLAMLFSAEPGASSIVASTECAGPAPIMLVGVKVDDAVRTSLARVAATSFASNQSGLVIPWETRVLEASRTKLTGILNENRNDVLRRALLSKAYEAGARVCSGWLNNTPEHWLDWAIENGNCEDTSPIASGARNETLSAQVLYAPPGKPLQVTCRVSDLKGRDGAVIPAAACQVRLVEYVELEGTWYPDPLMEGQPFTPSVNGPTLFWLTIHVPEDAKLGDYTATATMQADGGTETTRELAIRVWPITLPSQTNLHTSFWLSRAQINRWFDLPGDVPMEDYYPWIDLATSHRLSPIDFVEGPTVPMVKVFREADGKLSYDFSYWDKYLDRLKLGGANTVHLGFTHWMAHYFTGNQPEITDRATGEPVKLGYAFASAEHLDALADYLRTAAEHVKAKGFDFVYIQPWDEPNGEGLANSYAILKGLKDRVPDIPRLMTAVGPATFDGKMGEVVTLWCPLSPAAEGGAFDAMRERGDMTWWYVCCGPGKPYANLFTHWRAPEMRMLFWQSWQYRMTGLLYWSMNYWFSWGSNLPPKDQRFPRGPWKAETIMGDGYFMYPSTEVNKPFSSIRLETIRDGIEDYDLLYLLNSLVEQRPDADAATLARAREVLRVPPEVSKDLVNFDRDGKAMDAAREEIAGLVERLQ